MPKALIYSLWVTAGLLVATPALAVENLTVCDSTPFKQKLAQIAAQHLIDQAANFKRGGVLVMRAEELGGSFSPGTWIVYFSSFACGEHGLDGGGWDVVIDPKTLKILKSSYSDL
ncbi:hypothetical protein [Taklimakanibacter lacteus]|uniref:hypothetical protein n=1 Tax=Taklimakanibacter lacteus TaxID=2268456 RepID=UPI000E675F48